MGLPISNNSIYEKGRTLTQGMKFVKKNVLYKKQGNIY